MVLTHPVHEQDHHRDAATLCGDQTSTKLRDRHQMDTSVEEGPVRTPHDVKWEGRSDRGGGREDQDPWRWEPSGPLLHTAQATRGRARGVVWMAFLKEGLPGQEWIDEEVTRTHEPLAVCPQDRLKQGPYFLLAAETK